MWRCLKCNTEIADGINFCCVCNTNKDGTPCKLNSAKEDPNWNCKVCGQRIESTLDVCWKCGTGKDGSPPSADFIRQEDQVAQEKAVRDPNYKSLTFDDLNIKTKDVKFSDIFDVNFNFLIAPVIIKGNYVWNIIIHRIIAVCLFFLIIVPCVAVGFFTGNFFLAIILALPSALLIYVGYCFAIILTRVVSEYLIVSFRTSEDIREIKNIAKKLIGKVDK